MGTSVSLDGTEKVLARVQAAREARDYTGVLFESVLVLTQVVGTLSGSIRELSARVEALERAMWGDGRD